MGCCSSRPTESEITRQDSAVAPRVRQSSQATTSQTAINNTAHDRQTRTLEPTSGTSTHHSETSRSPISTPRHSSTNNINRPQRFSLAEHYNLPLKAPKKWTSNSRTWTRTQLERERYEFFETRVTGRTEVWEALRQVAESIREDDISTAQGILDAVGVTLPSGRIEDGGYDEVGNLYKIPEVILRDPTNAVVDNNNSAEESLHHTPELESDDQDTTRKEVMNNQEVPTEKLREEKGKATIDKDALKVKCRLSDRGGPDVIVLLGRSQHIRVLVQRVKDEGELPDAARIRVAYLGKILDENQTLIEQGWKEGHVINALIAGFTSA